MPWTTKKRKCKQSDGTSGNYVVLKQKSGGGTEQASCHTSEKKAKGSVGARYANEGKMRITERRLRNLIRRTLLNEWTAGYSVPDFENTESMMLFLDELEPDDTVETDVVDPETGEIWLEAGMTPIEAGLVELEEEEPEAESDPDELDNYDWDAYDREMEQKHQARLKLDDEMQEKI